jgi:hypothetical protein
MIELVASIINYKTLDLTKTLVDSLLKFYPDLPILLIDNGSFDESTEYIRTLDCKNVQPIFNEYNYGHGPALNQALTSANSRYVLTLDSDCKVLKKGWIELMLEAFKKNRKLYAIGQLLNVDIRGYNGKSGDTALYHPYVHPSTAMFDVAKYLSLKPMFHHGAPCLQNMLDAKARKYDLADFPNLRSYVSHQDGGTSVRHGGWSPNVKPMKEDRPFLSIVTRCHKRPQGLQRCLESISKQTDPDYENVLIVDTKGIGVIKANGLFYQHRDRVRGEYVHLLDDDDVLVDTELVWRLKCIAKTHGWPDVIMFRAVHPGGQIKPPDKLWGQRPVGSEIGGESYVVKREIWKRHIKTFGEHGYPGDFYFITELFNNGYSIFWCDTVIAQAFTQNIGKPE